MLAAKRVAAAVAAADDDDDDQEVGRHAAGLLPVRKDANASLGRSAKRARAIMSTVFILLIMLAAKPELAPAPAPALAAFVR